MKEKTNNTRPRFGAVRGRPASDRDQGAGLANQDIAELRKRVNQIRLLTVRLVNDQLSGEYHSSFKGQGIEFDEVRPYVPGDDVRSIDWNVTARSGYPHIKRYAEERELTVIFLVDVSGSQNCGSGVRTKSELAAFVTCILAMAATENADNVGLINFSDRIEKFIPPRKGRTAVMRIVRDVLAAEDETHGGTDIAEALRYLNNVHKRRALVFLVSDFQDRGYGAELKAAARRHDLVTISISDPREFALENAGLVEIQDPETGDVMLLDTSSAAVREEFRKAAEEENAALEQSFLQYGIDNVALSTGDSDDAVVLKLRRLFGKRGKRR